jgi:hypothetical protein
MREINNIYIKYKMRKDEKYMEEREEILKHKWIESEKAGKDVGFEWALLDWNFNHRTNWRNNK